MTSSSSPIQEMENPLHDEDDHERTCSWGLLPEGLGDQILARLPRRKDISKLRIVCKEWNAKLSPSSSFWKLHRELHPTWLLLHEQQGQDTEQANLHTCRVTDHGGEVRWERIDPSGCPPSSRVLVLEWVPSSTSGNDLVCINRLAGGFFVGNPLALKPCWSHHHFYSMQETGQPQGMILWALLGHAAHGTKGGFNVLFLLPLLAQLAIFGSEKEEWDVLPLPQELSSTATSNPAQNLDSLLSLSPACIGERVYCIHGKQHTLHSYHTITNEWCHYPASLLPQDLLLGSRNFLFSMGAYFLQMPPKIVQGPQGQVLLVGGRAELGCSNNNALVRTDTTAPNYSVGVWELVAPTVVSSPLTFKLVSVMPNDKWISMLHHHEKRSRQFGVPIHFSGQSNLVLVYANGCRHCIAYSINEDTWFTIDFPTGVHVNNNLKVCLLDP